MEQSGRGTGKAFVYGGDGWQQGKQGKRPRSGERRRKRFSKSRPFVIFRVPRQDAETSGTLSARFLAAS